MKKPTISQFYKLGFNLKRESDSTLSLVLGQDSKVITSLPTQTTFDEVLQVTQYFLERSAEENSEGWKKNWVPVLQKIGLT